MSILVEPRLIVEIDDVLVHFFDAPGGEDWPHLALADVIALIRSPFPEATAHKIENDPEAAAAYVATENGLVVLVPRAVAYGLVRAAVKGGLVHATVFDAVEAGVLLATDLQLVDLSDAEKRAWAARVHQRNGGFATPTRGLPQ